MILIDNVLINEDVFSSKFQCDLKQCKGACCTFPGDSGAPVTLEEIEEIEKSYPIFKKYLSDKSINYIESNGYWEKDGEEYLLNCIDKKDCVFVFYEGDVAKCSIEKAYHNNEIEFRKPLSCHLFPIRVGYYGGEHLRYEKFDECEPGRLNGEKNNIQLIESVKESIERKYGKEFFEKLKIYMESE